MRFLLSLFAVIPGLLAVGCGHVAVVEPAPLGRVQIEGALGGPMVNVGGRAIPVPLATAGARYGFAERLDVAAHAHLTSLAFGVGGLDVGGAYQLLLQEGAIPALTLSSRLYGFAALRGGALGLIDATATASYATGGKGITVYLAPTVLQPFAAAPVTFSVGAGVSGRLGDTRLQLEARWYQPHVNSSYSAADWVGLGDQGAFGLVLGISHLMGEGS